MRYLQKYMSEKMSVMSTIKSFLGKQVDENTSLVSEPLIVSPRYDYNALNQLTKKEVIAFAHANSVAINSRKKKEELIEIILRS